MSQAPETETASEDQWMVAIAPGNVQMMDVDQLDASYQAGQINENTMVWTQGMDAWLPLAEVIGGDESDATEQEAVATAPAQPAPQPNYGALQQAGVQQQAVVQQQVDATQLALQQQADAASAAAFSAAQQGQAYGQGVVAQAQGAFPGAAAPQPGPGAPIGSPVPQPAMAQPFQPAAAFGAAAPAQFGAGGLQPNGQSTAPVALNMDALDLDSLDMPKKKSKFGLIAAAALVLGAGGVTAMNLGGGDSEKPVAAAAAAGAEKTDGTKSVKSNDPNAPLDMGTGYTVTEAEKNAFAKEADKDKELRDKMAQALTGPNGEVADTSGKPSKAAAKGAMKAKFGGGAKKSSKSSAGSGVSKGGSSFDPLNGEL